MINDVMLESNSAKTDQQVKQSQLQASEQLNKMVSYSLKKHEGLKENAYYESAGDYQNKYSHKSLLNKVKEFHSKMGKDQ